jgi:hypothetical protein
MGMEVYALVLKVSWSAPRTVEPVDKGVVSLNVISILMLQEISGNTLNWHFKSTGGAPKQPNFTQLVMYA